MAIWDKNEPAPAPTPTTNPAPQAAAQPAPAPAPRAAATSSKEESLIASGITVEGKINGKGNVRVAGKFKGDIQVEGDLAIDSIASVEGQVKAGHITVNGTLQGNIESASHVELKQGSTVNGDIKAATLSVTSGARMRGNVEFGFTESK